ncbi:MAG TPA: KGG domain-containing protein [Candidatus Thermoplasmatota archaeon]|nr:KGG domain-containing protein [Candidatus Thermoplasmatota archaeon]
MKPEDETEVERQGEAATETKEERPMTIEEAARKGGNTTKQRYGPDFYSRIGRKGGQRVARERGPEFYSEIGRKGGEARVAQSRKLEREPEGSEAATETRSEDSTE